MMMNQTLGTLPAMPPLMGLAALMRKVFDGEDLRSLAAALRARAEQNPADANALLDLSILLQLSFQQSLALQIQAEALSIQRLYHIPAAHSPVRLRLLVLMGEGELISNTPVECLLEDSDIDVQLLYVSSNVPLPEVLPEHDVLFVAIAESEYNMALLYDLKDLGQAWPRPIINLPIRIAMLSRDTAFRMLADIPGVRMPAVALVTRALLQQVIAHQTILVDLLHGATFPIIIRPVDSHAGRGLAKVEDEAALTAYLQTTPELEFYIAPFVDYRSTDGQYRKYRLVLMQGQPYICHLAISSHWMIHYLNAGMAESPEKLQEEARCFAEFDSTFARRHQAALAEIHQRVGLEYLGIDCGETQDGKLLIFEVDSNMVVHALDPVEAFPYKQPHMRKVFAAFREMLVRIAERPQ